MATRALTGAAYVVLTLGAAWAGPFTTFLLFLPVTIVAGYEMQRLIWKQDEGLPMIWGMAVVGIVYTVCSLGVFDGQHYLPLQALAVLSLTLATVLHLLLNNAPDPTRDVGGLLSMIALVALPFSAMIHLFAHGTIVFVGFMVMLWTADTGAYLVGRAIGRTKLMSAVSPNKTVEGFVGGVVATMGAAYLFSRSFSELDTSTWLACGAIVASTSTLGDLLESAFKRARGVKDSGTILPGHGGMLDRFDGALLAAPAMFIYLAMTH